MDRRMCLLIGFLAAFLTLLAASTPARADLLFNGGNGAISFGVAPYGGHLTSEGQPTSGTTSPDVTTS
jgi:hypothetical protein